MTGRRVSKHDAGMMVLAQKWADQDLLEACKVLVEHASEAYPHFESERGQADIAAARAAIKRAEGGHR